jgi:arginine transport system permease protein
MEPRQQGLSGGLEQSPASASTYEPFTWYAAAALIYLAISLVSEFGLKQASRYTRRYGG